MKTPTLTNKDYQVLLRLLQRLVNEDTWLHSQWYQDASDHEVSVIGRVVQSMEEKVYENNQK